MIQPNLGQVNRDRKKDKSGIILFPSLIAMVTVVAAIIALLAPASALAFDFDPLLQQKLTSAAAGDRLVAVVTFDQMPAGDTISEISRQGVFYHQFEQLPMVVVAGSPSQIRAIADLPGIVSIYSDRSLDYFTHESVPLVGGSRAQALFGYSGAGIGVAILDSGIDGTHPDVAYPARTVQNTKIVLGDVANQNAGLPNNQPVFQENVPITDTSSGHGTHVAGIAGGDGTARPGYWVGMAPKSNLIGVGTGETLLIVNALEGFDYILSHQQQYNIRVVNCSWGTSGDYIETDPVNVATHIVHDRGITVVFAAGNDGPGENTLNPYAVSPWVIGVGATAKNGISMAGFSSVGVPGDPLRHPTLVAPGTEIVSAKSSIPVVPLTSLSEDPPPTSAYYTRYVALSGTSMATPFVTGAVADILEANPGLGPDDVKKILSNTAEPLPGFGVYQQGSGMMNIDRALASASGRFIPVDAALKVTSVSPATGSTDVPDGSKVVLQFSQPLNPASVNNANIYLVEEGGRAAATEVTYDATGNQVTITPSANLRSGTKYFVVVTAGVQNTAGRYPLQRFSSAFNTQPCTLGVTPIGCLV